MPTPTASEHTGSDNNTGQGAPNLRTVVANDLLPTPVTHPQAGNGHARHLGAEAKDVVLLPTTTAQDAESSGGSKPDAVTLTDAVVRTELGTIDNPRHYLPTPSTGVHNDGEDPAQWKARHDHHASKDEDATRSGKPLTIAAKEIPLLPTPLVSEAKGTGPADANRDTVQLRAIEHLLPTPTTQETHSGPSQEHRNTPPLNARVLLLPTVVAAEGEKGGTQVSSVKGANGQIWLSNVAQDIEQQVEPVSPTYDLTADGETVNWGKYRPAIKRAEAVLGRLSPSPTKPDGRDGKRRLNSALAEFMMMLPDGHVVGRGLTRTQELARLGNGVVPLQAAVTITMLLRRHLQDRRP